MFAAEFTEKVNRGLINILLSTTDIVSRSELQEIAMSSGRLHYFGTEESFEVTYSGDEETLPAEFEESEGRYKSARPFYCVLDKVTLYGREPICLSADGIVLEFTHDDIGTLKYRLKKNLERRGLVDVWNTLSGKQGSAPHIFSDEVYLSLVKEPGYFHWVTEYATKIRAWEEFAAQTGIKPKILLSPDSPRYEIEFLQLLGVEKSQLAYWDTEIGVIDSLLIPIHRPHLNRDMRPHLEDLRWLRAQVLENVDCNLRDEYDSARVYVSREDADCRRIRNRTEVEALLSEYGFDKYILSEMSVAEQVALFSNADFIFGSHGAGLANIVYSTKATVLELLPSNRTYAFYFILSNVLGHQYDFVMGKPISDNVSVDPTTLRLKLDALMSD